jgi:hypothetical protein
MSLARIGDGVLCLKGKAVQSSLPSWVPSTAVAAVSSGLLGSEVPLLHAGPSRLLLFVVFGPVAAAVDAAA